MERAKHQFLGKAYLVELSNSIVELWQIMGQEKIGRDTFHQTLTFIGSRQLPLTTAQAQELVNEYLPDYDSAERQSVEKLLSEAVANT